MVSLTACVGTGVGVFPCFALVFAFVAQALSKRPITAPIMRLAITCWRSVCFFISCLCFTYFILNMHDNIYKCCYSIPRCSYTMINIQYGVSKNNDLVHID